MPDYNLPAYAKTNDVKDQNQYEKMPIWLARQEVKAFADFHVFDKLFGSLKWKPNMGNNLRGVRAEKTPIGRQIFLPKPITEEPLKDIIDQEEVVNDSVLRMHYFDSLNFHFLPSYADFRDSQIGPINREIARQIAFANDMFIRSWVFEMADYVYVAGATTPLQDAPSNTGDPGMEEADMFKDQTWRQARVADIQGAGISLRQLDTAVAVMRDDVGAPFFEGLQNGSPAANEMVKGKYCLLGSSEMWQQWKWDPDMRTMLGDNQNLVVDGFRGSIFGDVTYKTVRYPLRVAVDGSLPVPEIMTETRNKTVPNPAYVNAPYEIAFLVAADAAQSISIGPPPADFAGGGNGGGISMKKFKGMRWNGEIELTDDILVTRTDGATTYYDTNRRREQLQLQSTLAMGCISNESRSCMPIMFARKRAA